MKADTMSMKTLRDAVLVAVVAVLTVQGLRRFCGERYIVPSDSMQPLLYGDPQRGDVVFVDRMSSAGSRRRGDLVVVDSPKLEGHQLVKRIAARGDDSLCWVDIVQGDIWLGENAQQMRREVKDPRAAMSRSVTWARAGDAGPSETLLDLSAAASARGGRWKLTPMAANVAAARAVFAPERRAARHSADLGQVLPGGTVGTARFVDASFLDLAGVRRRGGEDVTVADCGMEMRFDNAPAVILLTIDSTDFATTFVWSATQNELQVWVDGRRVVRRADVLEASWAGYVAFGRLDGRDFLLLDDDHQYARETPKQLRSPRPRTWLHVGVVGAEAAYIESMRVFRDLYAYRDPVTSVGEAKPWPKFVRPGHWFLLGDNAFDSRDSRHFGDVAAETFLGVPAAVIAPWSRARAIKR